MYLHANNQEKKVNPKELKVIALHRKSTHFFMHAAT